MPRFAANLSLLFTETGLIERFRLANECGFDAVEIQFPFGLSAEAIARELAEQQLKLVLFNVPANDLMQGGEGLACVPEKRDLFRKAVDQALAYARLLKPAAVNVLPGCCFDPNKREAYLETFKQNLLYAADAFSTLGVKTVFEAINTVDMPGFIIHGGDRMLAVLDELDDHPGLYLQYDIYHMQMMGENPVDFIRRNASRIGHIQFADCPGRGEPGTGNIDFDEVFSAIDESGYVGWVGAEYKPQGTTAESLGWFGRFKQY